MFNKKCYKYKITGRFLNYSHIKRIYFYSKEENKVSLIIYNISEKRWKNLFEVGKKYTIYIITNKKLDPSEFKEEKIYIEVKCRNIIDFQFDKLE